MSCGILNLQIGAFYDSSICKGTFVMGKSNVSYYSPNYYAQMS